MLRKWSGRALMIGALALSLFAPAAMADGRDVVPAHRDLLSPLRPRVATDASVVRTLDLDAASYATLRTTDRARLRDFALSNGESVDLLVQRFNVLADDAELVVSRMRADGSVTSRPLARPDAVLLRGSIAGMPDSRVFLALSPGGSAGYIATADETWVMSSGEHGANRDTVIYRIGDVPMDGAFDAPVCQADTIDQPLVDPGAPIADPAGAIAGVIAPCRQARLAVETDHEFLANLFGGDTNAAALYAMTIFAASSEIYQADLNVRFNIGFLRLWETPDDPWNQGGAGDQLVQFRDYWVANEGGVDRVLAHYLSPRGLGGGVAWLGAVCSETNGYGLSGNLNGTFPYPLEDHSGQNWDIMVVSHELGHNIGAPHTHSYNPPLDGCGLGDCSEAYGGTIMSYCHTCDGGLTNIVLNFHPVNINTMLSYLDSTCDLTPAASGAAANDDYVVTPVDEPIFVDALGNEADANCLNIAINNYESVSDEGGTVVLSPGSGPDGRDELLYTPPAGFDGSDAFDYDVQNSNGDIGKAKVFIDVFAFRAADNPIGVEPGSDTAYYELVDPEVLPDFDTLTPYLSEVVPNVDFPSTGGNFAGSGLADNVGAVFSGYVEVPASAVYTFYTNSDDGSRLLVGDEAVVLNDGLHGMVEKAGTIALQAGRHAVRVEFFERGGGAGVIASISGGGLSKQVIGAGMWSHGGMLPGDGDLDGDGVVGPSDLAALLADWGPCVDCPADLNGDGVVDAADLAILLANWG